MALENTEKPLFHFELKSGPYFTFLDQGGINIAMCGSLDLTEKQVEGLNRLLGGIYGLDDPDLFDDNDVKQYRKWELKYVEILKERIRVEQEMIKFLEA